MAHARRDSARLLARVRRMQGQGEALARLPHDAAGQPAHGGAVKRPVALRFDALTLFESRLSHEGVSHRPIVSAPIAQAERAAGGQAAQ